MENSISSGNHLFTISQVNAITGIPKPTIRYWEKEFKDFLIPLRTHGNQRRYDQDSIRNLERINRLVKVEGYTLDGARKKIDLESRADEANPGKSNVAEMEKLASTVSEYLLQKVLG